MSAASEIEKLIAAERLPASFASTVEDCYRPIANAIEAQQAKLQRTAIIGLCGPQGSGKSTMAAFLKLLLEQAGKRVAILSIDDLYLTRAERERLSREVHPLLLTRGVPGTHDVAMGTALFDALGRAKPDEVIRIPRFDKSADDRAADFSWTAVTGRPDVILFEGWCVGAKPELDTNLAQPINQLEAERDKDGAWRRYVNQRLASDYQKLFGRIDYLIMLKPPSFDCVFDWRKLQEEKLRARAPQGARLMSPAEIATFIMHYERVSRHILREMPHRADIVAEIDAHHKVTGVKPRT